MNEDPHVWHYGLIAQIWAEFSNETPELAYYEEQIERFGEPVLDLACGTGRLLLPLLRTGIDIDGCDISADMLAYCQRQAQRDNLPVRLFEQPMHRLELKRRYKTIYICGSFGLAGSRQFDQKTLERCYTHLQPGGALLFNVDVEYADPEAWAMWLKDKRTTLPQPWPAQGKRYQSAAGYVLISRSRYLDVNPLDQSYTRAMRVEKWLGRELIEQEERTLSGNMYFKNEVVAMLHSAGFSEITVNGDYTDQRATADSSELNFIARK